MCLEKETIVLPKVFVMMRNKTLYKQGIFPCLLELY